ncbi:MAG TPA: methyltransferase domain-containing protein [Dehalococcoidia bacterium]|nr:methyltransferase domain-containing protein [Dehalococcoidia bacterium]
MVTTPLDLDALSCAVQDKYTEVATDPDRGFHFHTGRPLAALLGYPDAWVAAVPDAAVRRFAGVGNPFQFGTLPAGTTVLDVGCGAGFDAQHAARQVGTGGRVIGVDMTPAMLAEARAAAAQAGLSHLEFREGRAERLPLADASVDIAISNGAINLCPDKAAVYRELWRVLKPGGRLQIADVMVQIPVPDEAKAEIDLWTG